jgi:hypothetical protein
MHEAVKEGYGGGGGLRRDYHFYGIIIFLEVSLGLQRGELNSVVGLDQYRHRFVGGFGHGGLGYPYDILELGSCPS